MENLLICSKSFLNQSGIYFNIFTNNNHVYNFKIKGKLIKGNSAFVYCEDRRHYRHISRRNLFLQGIEKEFNFNIKGINGIIYFGILFLDGKCDDDSNELNLNYIEISNNGSILNNIENLNLHNTAIIRYNNSIHYLRSETNVMDSIICESLHDTIEIFNKYNINQLFNNKYIKNTSIIRQIYNLNDYIDITKPLLICGICNNNELETIKSHKGNIYILLENQINECLKYFIEQIKLLKNVTVFSASPNLEKYLNGLNVVYINLNINLDVSNIECETVNIKKKICLDNELINDMEFNCNENAQCKQLCHTHPSVYNILIKKFPEYNFVFSNDFEKEKYYLKFKILKKNNIINSQFKNDIVEIFCDTFDKNYEWNLINEIEFKINSHNINIFNDNISQYSNIMIIITNQYGDHDVTFMQHILKMYNTENRLLRSKFVGLLITNEINNCECPNNMIIHNPDKKNNCENILLKLKEKIGNPDLIIIKNYVDIEILKHFNCPKYFWIPTIFKQNLNKCSDKILKDELNNYISKQVIHTLNICDKSFTNNYETKQLLENYFNKNVEILPFYHIGYHNNYVSFDYNTWINREYDIGFIMNTSISQNINLIIRFIKLLPKEYKMIIIGNNCTNENNICSESRFSGYKMDNVNCANINIYKNIKYIVDSAYHNMDSCTEPKINGCKIVQINEENFKNVIKNICSDIPKVAFGIPKIQSNIIQLNKTEISKIELLKTDIIKPMHCSNDIEKENNVNKLNNNTNTILIISTQYPCYGGAATIAYKLHEKLLEENYNSYCLFIHDKTKCKYNPLNLRNVFISKLYKNYKKENKCYQYYEKTKLLLPSNPKIIIGFNYIAPVIGKYMYPTHKVFYYITGNRYISLQNISAVDYLKSKQRNLNEIDDDEVYCMNMSDYIIPNSNLTYNVYVKMYPEYKSKYTNTITFEHLFADYSSQVNYENYLHDIAVISSRFDRSVKNIDLINDIYNNDSIEKYNKICIGKDSDKYINNAHTHYGFKSDEELINILHKTKIILITSKYESFSLTLLNGLRSNAIVLSNVNVGASKYLKDFYIIDSDDPQIWTKKIEIILENYEYHKNIFKINIPKINISNKIQYLCEYNDNTITKNVLFVSVDKPYQGGCSTNTYNMIKSFKSDDKIRPIGLFISNENNSDNINPLNLNDVYHITYNEKIEENLNKIISEIELKCGYIDIIFAKNYKALTCMYWINKTNEYKQSLDKRKPRKIIFSPSGIRTISNMEMFDSEKCVLEDNNIKYDETIGLYNFINKYDQIIEKYLYDQCDCIIPNSRLTFKIINKIYNVGYKLKHPCNITYIDYNKYQNIEMINRDYDIAFICYSWKRKVKNYDLVKKIITDQSMDKYKILIIGLGQIKYPKKNITSITNCSNDDILKYLSNTKLLCITSYFDSSPNVLKEGLMCKCNILISKRVGSYEYFESDNIINKINDTDEWLQKIELNMNKKLNLINFYPQQIKNQLKHSIYSYYNKNHFLSKEEMSESAVGIYKLPALWNEINFDDNVPSNYNYDENINIADIIKNDIYFKLFMQNDKYNCKNFHYIIINTNKEGNKYIKPYITYPYLSRNIYIWEIADHNFITKFRNAKYYFLRGNYYDAYSQYINEKSTIVLYPATSLIYDSKMNLVTNRIIKHAFNYVIYDDIDHKNLWEKMFPKSTLINYNKPVNTNIVNLNLIRDIDYIFVATELQITKNRHLFVNFINYCENAKIKINVVNIGKLDQYFNNFEPTKMKYVNLISFDKISCDELIQYYNRSKINLIFSGRDALPRVVTESIACGCYNLALDTMSDGKYLYNNIYGTLLSFPNIEKTYDETAKSISYVSNNIIFEEILKYKNIKYNHNDISSKFIESISFNLNIN